MGKSIIIPDADFSSCAIQSEDALTLIRSAEKVRALKVSSGSQISKNNNNLTSLIFVETSNNYGGYTYAINVQNFVGRQIRITFCDGYGSTILANGGFLETISINININNEGWSPSSATEVTYISEVCEVTSAESNVWVTKTYTVPSGAKYLLFTSKYNNDGTAGAELVD